MLQITRTARAGRRGVGTLVVLTLGLLVTGCASGNGDASAPYFAASPPVAPADVVAMGLPATGTQATELIKGGISRPDPKLTPGAVAISDVTQVCKLPRHTHRKIPVDVQRAVFQEYGYAYPGATNTYILDWLVPLELGGAPVKANLWPAMAKKGVGFHQKAHLNARLRHLVCSGVLSLTDMQSKLMSDWYTLWFRYATTPTADASQFLPDPSSP
jgi:hypothetical protein